MKKQCIGLLILISSMNSCKKENPIIYTETNAMVLNAGNIASDGCGWLLKIDGNNAVFSPINLPQLLKTDSLQVTVSYNVLATKFNCSTGNSFTQITIHSIRKKGASRPQ